MKGTTSIPALAFLALLAGGTTAAATASVNRHTGLIEPPLSDLRKAAESGDRAELSRAANRLGPGRLAKALADSDHRLVLAALEGIPLLGSGILLLEDILPLLDSTNDAILGSAVRATAALLARSDAERLAEWEVTPETTRASCRGLARVAANESGQLAMRLSAMQGLADSGATCAGSLNPARVLWSREPEIRRAAVLALPADPSANDTLLAAAKDGDGLVAAAAGARLCGRQEKLRPLPAQPPLGRLALARGAAPEDIVEMLVCLAGSSDAADHKALDQLKTTSVAAVREAIAQLREKAQ